MLLFSVFELHHVPFLNRGHVFADEKSFIADIAKETVDEFVLYEERGWTRATADQVVEEVVSYCQQVEV